jgi:TetR/AcrR family transcriptional regulator
LTPASTRSGRERDAEAARQAILDAAEEVFAANGFDGARIDAIAEASGYNKSLIFHYFGDKLGLYAEVLKRADDEMTALQQRVITPMFQNEAIFTNAQAFKAFLETIVASIFDYMAAHPRFIRTMLWEQAEGWQTYSKLASQFETSDVDQFDALFRKAYEAGLLRSDFNSAIQLTMMLQTCLGYLTFIPLYQMFLHPGEDLTSPIALQRAKAYIVSFVVHGMMTDLPETKP